MPTQKLTLCLEDKETFVIRGKFRGLTFAKGVSIEALQIRGSYILSEAILATKKSLILYRKFGVWIIDSGGGINSYKVPNKFNFSREIKKIKWVITYDEVMGVERKRKRK